MKITFYQKGIGSQFSQLEKTKLAKERSDFLLLPQRIVYKNLDLEKGIKDYSTHLDHLLDLSEFYKGVVLGGTVFRSDTAHPSKKFESVPILQEYNLIDHYDLRTSDMNGVDQGDSEIAFIMAGVRFSILSGKDLENTKQLDEISEKGITVIFYLDGLAQTRSYDEDLDFFTALSKERNWNIFRICGHDVEKGIYGRSLVSTPTGIQWKVGKIEEDRDILKTIHFAQANPFL